MGLDILPERILSQIKVEGECWIWQGAVSNTGYGAVNYQGGTKTTHKVFWEAENGPVPLGLELGHSCHRKRCCYPAHLSPMTHQDNMRMKTRPRLKLCKKGLHLMTPSNSYWFRGKSRLNGRPLRHRLCRICKRSRDLKYQSKGKI